jgi:hypothetical protein
VPTALDGAVQYQPVYDIFIAFDLCITSLTTHTLSAELENKKISFTLYTKDRTEHAIFVYGWSCHGTMSALCKWL